ncbi:hypothetical protein DFJ73DRAFT_762473 [Zopfochytrium polystomum]|nr:hypothetical protein DFJ73DRAFT_762473 [Zopfochytrium polystomum]
MSNRKNVIQAWQEVFINEEFEDKIDSNPYLIGFDNGVYDLTQKLFRPNNNDDFVTMSVGYKYDSNGNGKRDEMIKFFEDIIPNEADREFLSTLVGINREERLGIFTGNARNGKGALTDLLKVTLGDYFGTTGGSFIQGERPDSCAPQPDLLGFGKKRIMVLNEIDDN